MTGPVSALGPAAGVAGLSTTATRSAAPSAGAAGSFGETVNQIFQATNADQHASETAIRDLMQGKTDNIQDVVMTVSNAELSFQFFMEVRNRVIDAWNDLMRMQF